MEIKNKIEIYLKNNGKAPFIEWLESLDKTLRYRVKERLNRVCLGNFGDHKSIDFEISELRLSFGAGYRIYYAEKNENTVLLLCAGSKCSQSKDIEKALNYWQDYLVR